MKDVLQKLYIPRVSIDSRTLEPGEVFCDLSCNAEYVHDAISRGARAIVSADLQYMSLNDEICVVNDVIFYQHDAYEFLKDRARYKRNNVPAKYIAVTGSVGKTSTKETIAHVLSSFCDVYKSYANFNNELGVPLCLSNIPASADIGVFEIGMSEQYEIARMKDIVQPDISVILNVEPVHLESLHSLSNIAHAKAEILPSNVAIVSADSAFTEFFIKKNHSAGGKTYTFSLGAMRAFSYAKGDCYVQEYRADGQYIHITAQVFDRKMTYSLQYANECAVASSLVSLMIAYILGYDVQRAADALQSYTNTLRLKIQHYKNCIWIDDTYNANMYALRSACQSMCLVSGDSRKILILGDFLGIGDSSMSVHQSIAAILGKYNIDKLLCTGKNMYYLHQIVPDSLWFESRDILQSNLEHIMQIGDVVLVKASHAMKMWEINPPYDMI